MKNEHKNTWKKLKSLFLILAGNFGLAAGIEFFVVPNGLITGGVAGIGLFLQTFFPAMRLSLFTFALNAAMLALGFFVLGRRFALTTLLSSVSYPAFMAILEAVFPGEPLTDNDLLAALYAGFLIGLSIGLVIREGASTGGMDIPVLIVHKFTALPVSALVYAADFIILLLQAFHNTAEGILYGVALLLVSSLVMDKILLYGNKKVQMKIVSEKYEEIRRAIIQESDRGLTVLYGETGYLREPAHMLLTVMSPREVARMRKRIHEIDETAFLMISEVAEVRGRGFTLDKNYRATLKSNAEKEDFTKENSI